MNFTKDDKSEAIISNHGEKRCVLFCLSLQESKARMSNILFRDYFLFIHFFAKMDPLIELSVLFGEAVSKSLVTLR